MIGAPSEPKTVCVAEGFATAATIYEATGHIVAIAFNAGNLEPVARALQSKFPHAQIVVCGDDDVSTQGNPGKTKAAAAAAAVNGFAVFPDFGPDRPAGSSDFNDLAKLREKAEVNRQIGAALANYRSEMEPKTAVSAAYPYAVEHGRICRLRQSKQGDGVCEYHDPLCNFNAQIKEEIVLDDGTEPQRAFVIEGRLEGGAPLPTARITAARFSGMNWITDAWGMRAVVRAGNGIKDYLREAIQRLSPDVRMRQVFTHTGWRKIGDKWVYLSGSTGSTEHYEVDLGQELSRYSLPAVIENEKEAMQASIALLKVAPLKVTAPLWAACFRAPLVSAFPQDLSIWVEGSTGSMKSTLTSLFLCHFGDFDRLHLPGAWASTANQLERRAFLLKDSVFLVDDFAPTAIDRRELELKASRLLRAQGNLAGRARLRSDLSERAAYYPRGVIISTGEQHPSGQSLLARTLVIELDRKDIDVATMGEFQRSATGFSQAMAGYVRWLAPQMNALPAALRELFTAARVKATMGNGEHLRIPEAAAHLWLGLFHGLKYAQEINAITPATADQIGAECWQALLEIGKEQAVVVDDEKPVKRFLTVLLTLIEQGRVCIVDRAERTPEPKAGVDFVGWEDADYFYLLPEAIFAAIVSFCRDTGEHFNMSLERIKKELSNSQVSHTSPGRLTSTVRIMDKVKRVLQLDKDKIDQLLDVEANINSQMSD